MDKYILTFLFSFLAIMLFAQEITPQGYMQLDDSLAARFSRGDFKSMYSYESAALKKKDPVDGFTGYFAGLLPETGRILSTKFLNKKGSHLFFEWFGEKKNERVEIVTGTGGQIEDYFLSDFITQPNSRSGRVKNDNPLKNRLDSAVQNAAMIYMSDTNSVGMSIGIIQKGFTFCYNYGEIKIGSDILPTAENEYNIGSIAKTFVGTLLAEAVVEGKAKLDDDIRKYLPGEYPNLEYKGIPIRLVTLSNHTSGLPTSPITIPSRLKDSLAKIPDSARFEFLGRIYKAFNADSLLNRMHYFTLDTIPGAKYVYNGNAMGILILILERIYQLPYEQLLTKYLHTHLGMDNTSSIFSKTNLSKFPQGYNGHRQAMPIIKVSQFISSPSINSTMHDMLKYIQANLDEKDQAIRLTHQITFDNGQGTAIGLNWFSGKNDDGGSNIFHLGQTSAGFTSLAVFYPEDKTGYVILVNDMISQGRLFDLANWIRKQIQD